MNRQVVGLRWKRCLNANVKEPLDLSNRKDGVQSRSLRKLEEWDPEHR